MFHDQPIQLITLAPAHFHAALVHKQPLTGVDQRCRVFAPLDVDLLTHLDRVRRFNDREHTPTSWSVETYAGADWLERFSADTWGNVAVIAGRNRPKITLIKAAIERGLHVLADKPCIVHADDLPAWQEALARAQQRGLWVRDIMTERHEITSQVQRELLHDEAIAGQPLRGTWDEPALQIESVHYLAKNVAGVPLVRPTWWYDASVAGCAPADVGTHLADLAMWILFPNQAIHPGDLGRCHVQTWPTSVPLADFYTNTGQTAVPASLQQSVQPDGTLRYAGNGTIRYELRGYVVEWTVRWEVGPDAGGDTHFAVARGSQADIVVRHDQRYGTGPQVFVVPKRECRSPLTDLQPVIAAMEARYPSWPVQWTPEGIHLGIPDTERHGHEAHFTTVLADFIRQIRHPDQRPAWETTNLFTKYVITTKAGGN